MVRRNAVRQALGRLALAAGLGSWAVGMGPMLPAHAETTAVKRVSASKVRETPNGVKYFDVVKGEGETPKQGDFVVISYTGCASSVVVGLGWPYWLMGRSSMPS